jgi:hypothetical protein
MNINEYVLNEGIRFYKTSGRIKRLSDKIAKKISLTTNGSNKDAVINIVHKLDDMSDDFRRIEEKYSAETSKSKRFSIQSEYSALEEKYSKLISMLNDERKYQIIKNLGVGSLISAIFFIMYLFFYNSGFGAEITSLGNYNPTGESVVGTALKDLGSKGMRLRKDELHSLAYGGGNKIERGVNWNDTISSLGDKTKFLKSEKEASLISASYATIGSSGILGIFNRLFANKKETNHLYDKTVSILEKL